MKSLLVMRHAKSSWKISYLADHDRPLNKRGKRDALLMGQLLREEQLVPDLIISSSARRAVDTADLFSDACGYEEDVRLTRIFYGAGSDIIIETLHDLTPGHQRVMIVGHNPGMEEFLEELTETYVRMPTAAIAYIELPIDDWAAIDEVFPAVLKSVWLPREL
jgi:phosphohistidine phosphatase